MVTPSSSSDLHIIPTSAKHFYQMTMLMLSISSQVQVKPMRARHMQSKTTMKSSCSSSLAYHSLVLLA
jgi:hypothetical protein